MIYDLIIIGYGISGLSCAKVAKANKLNFLVLEKSDQLGGCWNNALENTRLQTHRKFYQYSDFKMPHTYGDYPSKDNVLQYLRAVESYFNLDNHIKFNQNVKLIEYVNNTLWNIKTENNKKFEMYYAKHICVCSGYYNHPKIPAAIELYKNQYQGTILHSNQLNTIENFKCFNNKNLVIIGNGASACDFLCALEENNIQCTKYMIYRKNKYYIDKYIAGLSTSLILTKKILSFFKHISKSLYIYLFIIVNYFVFKNYLDLPTQKANSHNLIGTTIIPKLVNCNQLYYLRDTINYLDAREIYLNNNIIVNVDYIICATGYLKNYLPFQILINRKEIIYDNINYLQIVNPNIPKCGFIGLAPSYNWLVNSEKQSQWFINNIIIKPHHISKEIMLKTIKKRQIQQEKDELDYEDLTYELFTYLN